MLYMCALYIRKHILCMSVETAELLSLLCRSDDRSLFLGRIGRHLTHLLIILFPICKYKKISQRPVTNLTDTASCMRVHCQTDAASFRKI